MELLSQRDRDGLLQLAAADGRAVRPLSGRLWDDDPAVRELAAEAIAAAAEARPEQGREFVRRALWGLNDESATNGAELIPALGAIGARSPELMEPFAAPLAAYVEDASLRCMILDALTRLAAHRPVLVAALRDGLASQIDTGDPLQREALARLDSSIEGEANA